MREVDLTTTTQDAGVTTDIPARTGATCGPVWKIGTPIHYRGARGLRANKFPPFVVGAEFARRYLSAWIPPRCRECDRELIEPSRILHLGAGVLAKTGLCEVCEYDMYPDAELVS